MPQTPAIQPYRRAAELDGQASPMPVVIVGAGPVGLALAVDLARRGLRCTVIDDNDRVTGGSRALVWTQSSLAYLDGLGVGEAVRRKGIAWSRERVFHAGRELFAAAVPGAVNLQQYHMESLLIDRCAALADRIDLRFRHRVTGVEQGSDGVAVHVYTEDGRYTLSAGHLVACDGARSPVRGMLGLAFDGSALDERFLAADLALEEPFPPERQAWFDPPGHPGRTLLLHPQPDAMLRAELSLGPEPDPDTDRRPEVAARRLAAVLGERPFRLVSASVYAFHARRLARLVHGRVIFAGDSAHTLPPFGARGANGGLADAASLAPCLAGAGDLGDYDRARTRAADENLAAAAEAAAFLSPRSRGARALRDAVLSLAAVPGQARAMVNAGRLGA